MAFCPLIFSWLAGLFVHTYLGFWRKRYDENDHRCEYYQCTADLWHSSALFLAMASVAFFGSLEIEAIDWVLCSLTLSALSMMIPLWICASRRSDRYDVIISARYMEHKYGLDYLTLVNLTAECNAWMFPITSFESDIGASDGQQLATLVQDEVLRTRARDKVASMQETVNANKRYLAFVEDYRSKGNFLRLTELHTLIRNLRAKAANE